ncbi:hypothetical protein V2A60_002393 [Cordyceps javanica]
MVSLNRILNLSSKEPAPTEAASPTQATQSEEPATPNGPASPNDQTLSKKVASQNNADESGNGAPTNSSDISSPRKTIQYKERTWKFRGSEWDKPGILLLKLEPVGSDSGIELIRERDVHRESSKDLLQLWETIDRPEPENELYEPFKVIKIWRGKALMQWTGFDDSQKNLSMELLSIINDIAPELLTEYRDQRARHRTKGPAKRRKLVVQNAIQPKSQRSQRRTKQRLVSGL